MLAIDNSPIAFDLGQGPVLQHTCEPRQSRRLERHIGLETLCHSAMDYGLDLLFQELDQLLFPADVAPDPSIYVVDVANNGILLLIRRYKNRYALHFIQRQIPLPDPHSIRRLCKERDVWTTVI